MRTNPGLAFTALLTLVSSIVTPLVGWAAQAQLPEAASAVHELTGPSKTSLDARNWRLDPAVFTEITPFTAPDIAIELPLNQREEELAPLASPLPSEVSTELPIQAPAQNPVQGEDR